MIKVTERKGRPTQWTIRERERVFLQSFYDRESKTFNNQTRSAIAAGFPESTAFQSSDKVLTRYFGKSFKESAILMGLTKPYLAALCKSLLVDKKAKPAEVNAKTNLIKMLLNNLGEKTGDGDTTVNVNTPKALVIVGGNQKKLQAMLNPQLPAEADGQNLQP